MTYLIVKQQVRKDKLVQLAKKTIKSKDDLYNFKIDNTWSSKIVSF